VNQTDLVNLATTALCSVGFHRHVPFTVSAVAVSMEPGSINLELQLHYRCATPVCCPEPSCYTPFLGRHRTQVPSVLGAAFKMAMVPRVSIRVRMDYETGYRHAGVDLGEMQSSVIEYVPDDFLPRQQV
jgi:hypothetical protein